MGQIPNRVPERSYQLLPALRFGTAAAAAVQSLTRADRYHISAGQFHTQANRVYPAHPGRPELYDNQLTGSRSEPYQVKQPSYKPLIKRYSSADTTSHLPSTPRQLQESCREADMAEKSPLATPQGEVMQYGSDDRQGATLELYGGVSVMPLVSPAGTVALRLKTTCTCFSLLSGSCASWYLA